MILSKLIREIRNKRTNFIFYSLKLSILILCQHIFQSFYRHLDQERKLNLANFENGRRIFVLGLQDLLSETSIDNLLAQNHIQMKEEILIFILRGVTGQYNK